jgi:hypothetical protein
MHLRMCRAPCVSLCNPVVPADMEESCLNPPVLVVRLRPLIVVMEKQLPGIGSWATSQPCSTSECPAVTPMLGNEIAIMGATGATGAKKRKQTPDNAGHEPVELWPSHLISPPWYSSGRTRSFTAACRFPALGRGYPTCSIQLIQEGGVEETPIARAVPGGTWHKTNTPPCPSATFSPSQSSPNLCPASF